MIVGDGTTAEFTRELFGEVDWLWICQDTQTDDQGQPDTVNTTLLVHEIIKQTTETDVVISTQLPVGTCALMEARYPYRNFAVIPENYRTLAKHPTVDRLIVGTRVKSLWQTIQADLAPPLLRVSPESAEMVKHGINGFLALSIQYAHELARLATLHGADPVEVAAGLQSDSRIGQGSYLKPTGDYSIHLLREVHNLAALGGGPLIDVLEKTCWPS